MSTTGATVAIMETEPGSPTHSSASSNGNGVIIGIGVSSHTHDGHGPIEGGTYGSASSSNSNGANGHNEGEIAPPVYGETGSGAFV
jgi:hypothetical protein